MTCHLLSKRWPVIYSPPVSKVQSWHEKNHTKMY